MNSTTRWRGSVSLVVLWTLGIAPLVAPQPAAADSGFQGNLDAALALIFSGQGGEGGIGLTKLGPGFTVSALTGDEIRKVITGNTIRNNESVALYFDPRGAVESWFDDWTPTQDASRCPAHHTAGDLYAVHEGHCSKKTVVPVTGTWQVRNDRLCPVLVWSSGRREPCWGLALVLDEVVLFDESGAVQGRGKRLKKGRVLEQVVDNP